jgi:hypothetical protein
MSRYKMRMKRQKNVQMLVADLRIEFQRSGSVGFKAFFNRSRQVICVWPKVPDALDGRKSRCRG